MLLFVCCFSQTPQTQACVKTTITSLFPISQIEHGVTTKPNRYEIDTSDKIRSVFERLPFELILNFVEKNQEKRLVLAVASTENSTVTPTLTPGANCFIIPQGV